MGETANVSVELVDTEVPIGAPVWVEVTARNLGVERMVLRADLGPVLDPSGNRAAPTLHGNGSSGGNVPASLLAPGQAGAFRFDAAGAVRFDHAGTWTVTVQPTTSTVRGPGAASPQVSLSLRIVEPTAPAVVVAANPPGRRDHPQRPPLDPGPVVTVPTRWDALGDARFVPLLESDLRADPGDARAWSGLAACPCQEATDAWIRLYESAGPADRAEILEVLASRANELTAMVNRAPPITMEQREALRSIGWASRDHWAGVALVGYLGGDTGHADDALAELAALLAQAPTGLRAARVNRATGLVRTLPPDVAPPPDASEALRAVLALHALSPATPQDETDAAVIRALQLGDPALVALAGRHIRAAPSEPVALAMVPHLDRDPGGLQLRDPPDSPAVRAALLADVVGSPPAAQQARLEALSNLLPARDILDVLLTGLAGEPPLHPRLANLVAQVGIGPCVGGGSRSDVAAGEIGPLVAAWRRTLAAGDPLPIPPRQASAAMAPSGWSCTRARRD